MTWPDGTYVQYKYDGLNRMDEIRENGAAPGPGLLADYSYDSLDRRTNVARGNSYFSLTQSKSYTRDGLNRYATVGGVTFGYDGRDNLTSDGTRTFTYDLENHLLGVSGDAVPVSLTYDPNGRLLTTTSGGVATRYLYDGDNMVAEYNGSTLVRRYVHGAGTDEPVVWYGGAGLNDRRWLHTDHQGSGSQAAAILASEPSMHTDSMVSLRTIIGMAAAFATPVR